MARQRRADFEYGGEWIKLEPGRGYYRYWYERASGKVRRRTLGTTDFEQAKDVLVAHVLRNRKGAAQPAARVRLAVVFSQALEEHAPTISEEQSFGIRVAYLTAWYLDGTVAEVTRESQTALIQVLADRHPGDEWREHAKRVHAYVAAHPRASLPQSVSYISKIMKTLSKCLNHAHAHDRLEAVPHIITSEAEISRLTALPMPKARERVMSPIEIGRLFDAIESEHVFRWLIIALNTGARPEAVCELAAEQCDVEHRFVDLNPPGKVVPPNKRRPVIAMTNSLVAWARVWGEGRFVVIERKDKAGNVVARVPVGSIKKGFNATSARAGFYGEAVPLDRRVTRYTIRHTVATWMRSQGVPAWEVSGWLGHEYGHATTERYAKYAPDYLGQARAAVDALLRAVQKHTKRRLSPGPKGLVLPRNSHKRAAG